MPFGSRLVFSIVKRSKPRFGLTFWTKIARSSFSSFWVTVTWAEGAALPFCKHCINLGLGDRLNTEVTGGVAQALWPNRTSANPRVNEDTPALSILVSSL